jgi:hypothetical protein
VQGLNDLRIAAELARRQRDGVAMFRALGPDMDPRFPNQVGLFESQSSEMLIRGGNRSSKSMCAAMLFASIARDKPITAWNGKLIETRRQWQKGKPLRMWIIGLQLNHIGQTIYRLLFKAGAYWIIRDQKTDEFRAYRPWDPADVARQNERKPSFPLIPPSEIEQKGWSWHQKASRQFEVCHLKNGTEIWTFASTADVKQGDPVDVIWIDEAIQNPDHYEEWQMRLPDVKGRIFWSSWPRKGNPALVRLTERAAEQREEFEKGLRTKINVEEFLFTFSGNPFIDDEEKQKIREGLSEEQLRARDLGEYDLDNMKIYPWFDPSIHRAIGRIPQEDDAIGRILRDNNGVPPNDWTHELILDPGTAKPAILLCAIPPQELWEEGEPWFVPYKEFYKARQTADDLAREINEYVRDKMITFQRFIIDGQAARITPMGFAGTIGDHYSKAFEKHGLFCDQTGQFFTPGSPDFSQRVMVVENWLRMRRSRPQLRVVVEGCKQLVWQLQHNQKHVAENKVEEKEAKNQFNDVRVCLEYWASRNPTYVLRKQVQRKILTPYDRYRKWAGDRFGSREPSTGLSFGPGVR